MKRCTLLLLTLLLALSLLPVAGAEEALRGYTKEAGYIYVTLGRYPQWMDGGTPQEDDNTWKWASHKISDAATVSVEPSPVLWRVLEVNGERAYLCSEYILFAMPVHTNVTEYKRIGKDFGSTDLSHYLNGEFAQQAFTEEELGMLLPCETYGKVFLLDADDVKNKELGMGASVKPGLRAWGTEYAIRVTGAFVYSTQYGAHSPYWVRNQSSSDARHARCTKVKGTLGHIIADRDNEGVRPAVYLSLSAMEIGGGSGTMADPFVIVPARVTE